jgi:hypothetical protein
MDNSTASHYRQRISRGQYVDGTLDGLVDELGNLWVAAGERHDSDAQDAVGRLLDEATDRLDDQEAAFARGW